LTGPSAPPRYTEGHTALTRLLQQYPELPERKEVQALLDKAAARTREQQNGEYNMRAMYKKAKAGGHHSSRQLHRFEHADYIGPIQLVRIPGKGRGVVTTRSVAAGELVLAVKADDMQGPEEVSQTMCCDPESIVQAIRC
jgi:hypothetical protein